ncbi:MAG: type II toxin-antitoxin system RelB/DinJ family antitoxin [Desulfuromonadales bacterium]
MPKRLQRRSTPLSKLNNQEVGTTLEAVIRSRTDSSIKLETQSLLERFGLTMSEAIRLFLHQVVIEKGLPFQVKLPKAEDLEHDRWFRSQVEMALAKADKPETVFVPHSTVRDQWASKRQALAKRTGWEACSMRLECLP